MSPYVAATSKALTVTTTCYVTMDVFSGIPDAAVDGATIYMVSANITFDGAVAMRGDADMRCDDDESVEDTGDAANDHSCGADELLVALAVSEEAANGTILARLSQERDSREPRWVLHAAACNGRWLFSIWFLALVFVVLPCVAATSSMLTLTPNSWGICALIMSVLTGDDSKAGFVKRQSDSSESTSDRRRVRPLHLLRGALSKFETCVSLAWQHSCAGPAIPAL